jgi:hypothetical protein
LLGFCFALGNFEKEEGFGGSGLGPSLVDGLGIFLNWPLLFLFKTS